MISGVAIWADCDCGSGSEGEGEGEGGDGGNGGNGSCTGHVFTSNQELANAVNYWVVAGAGPTTQTYGQINTWCTSQVTDMSNLFMDRNTFNDDISNWDVSNVTNMSEMFENAHSFNQPIGAWDVSSVTNMERLFDNARAFNQNINAWDVSNVTDMLRMFMGAETFNQEIGSWNVSSVYEMDAMFFDASVFNKDISSWCVTNITSEPPNFSSNSPLPEANKPDWGTCDDTTVGVVGTATICDLIWTNTNSSETELINGGNIAISTTSAQMRQKYDAGQPAACYYNFDENESHRGLYYNLPARNLIKPPSGFRLPTPTDWSEMTSASCNPHRPNANPFGAPLPNNYNPNELTDTSLLGATGFNAYGYGGGFAHSDTYTLWTYDNENAIFWTSGSASQGGQSRYQIGTATFGDTTLTVGTWSTSTNEMANLRFVKNV